MKIAFYCRVDGQGFGFVLPDEADKLREFSPSIRISLRLKIHQAQAKIFVVCLTYGWRRSWKRMCRKLFLASNFPKVEDT